MSGIERHTRRKGDWLKKQKKKQNVIFESSRLVLILRASLASARFVQKEKKTKENLFDNHPVSKKKEFKKTEEMNKQVGKNRKYLTLL